MSDRVGSQAKGLLFQFTRTRNRKIENTNAEQCRLCRIITYMGPGLIKSNSEIRGIDKGPSTQKDRKEG